MSKTSILLLGATGYLGGSVLAHLLPHPSRDTFKIAPLVRSVDKAKKLDPQSSSNILARRSLG
ncbi:hypothetical protein BDY19DRAFT_682103 [Irpex rosettiformis]|uniref:Uncharacterized protein n=1 Tax=Irpex rosettiformis TaxID=378272 RepID=A0ACB8UA00_9APHY|nr:hypothetical protein BDY19DRAFT_682103 [Irpex rosettiformis]